MIEPGQELTAKLSLVDAAPEIHDADTGPIPPFTSHITRYPTLQRLPPPAPRIVTVRSDEYMMDAGEPRVVVSFEIPPDATRLPPTHVQAQYRPADSGASWRDLPTLTTPATALVVSPVTQGVAYDVRLRSYNALYSLASDWVVVLGHVVVGKTTPPPAPEGLTLDPDEQELRWRYPAPPPDFAGFEVRYAQAAGARWDEAQPLHDALVADTRFHLPPLTGTFTFLVKAEDTSGNQSADAAALIADLVAVYENVLQEIDYAAAAFPGTLINLTPHVGPGGNEVCSIPGDDPLFWAADTHVFWGADTDLFWSAKHGPGEYVTAADFTPADMGTTLTWDWHATAPGWFLEYYSSGDSLFWSGDGEKIWTTDAAPFWSGTPAWAPWPGAITVHAQRYHFRWRYQGNGGGCLDRAVLRLDVPDIDEYIPNVPVDVAGSRIPVARDYRAIKTVLLTVQQGAPGETLRTATVVDKDPDDGPLVRLNLVPSGTATAGIVDAHIRGY
jgi:hypothetical protein